MRLDFKLMHSASHERAAEIVLRHPKTVLFVTSLLRAREIKLATAVRSNGWKVILLYIETTPFLPENHFDAMIKVSTPEELHEIAASIQPRLCHVFSGAVDPAIELFCAEKPAPIVADMNDLFVPSLFNYCEDRFEPTRQCLALADGFCARDLQVKYAQRLDGYALPEHVIMFPEYSWQTPSKLTDKEAKPSEDEVHVVSVGTFCLETHNMYDSAYLQMAKMLTDQKIHFHIYPHWSYRKTARSKFNYSLRRDFAQFFKLMKQTPYLHIHESLSLDALAAELPKYDFGIISGGSEALGQRLQLLTQNYMDSCYSGRIADYLDARLPVLINREVRFNFQLLEHYGIAIDLCGLTQPGFRDMLVEAKRDRALAQRVEAAATTLSLGTNAARLARFYDNVIGDHFPEMLRLSPKLHRLKWIPLARGATKRFQERVNNHNRQMRDLASTLNSSTRQVNMLRNMVEEREDEIFSLRSSIAEQDERICKLNASISDLPNEILNLRNRVADQEAEIKALQESVEEKAARLHTQLGAFADLEAENRSLRRNMSDFGRKVDQLLVEAAAPGRVDSAPSKSWPGLANALKASAVEATGRQNNRSLHEDDIERLMASMQILDAASLDIEVPEYQLRANDISGRLNWPALADDFERRNGFQGLVGMIRAFAGRRSQFNQRSGAWQMLAWKNLDELLCHGFDRFKRTVGANYFNFLVQAGDPQIETVSGSLTEGERELCRSQAAARPDEPNLNIPNQFDYWYFVAALWRYTRKHDHLGLTAKLREPSIGEPLTMEIDGISVSQDLANSILEYYSMAEHVKFGNCKRILEVGAGYGRDAYVILSENPQVCYIIVDIPPALFIAQRYLSHTFRDRKIFDFRDFEEFDDIRDEFEQSSIAFLLPHQFQKLPSNYVDHCFSISSFGEMTQSQIARYFDEIDRVTHGTFFTKQWQVSLNPFDKLELEKSDYPIKSGWREVYQRPCAIQTAFFEALYRIERT